MKLFPVKLIPVALIPVKLKYLTLERVPIQKRNAGSQKMRPAFFMDLRLGKSLRRWKIAATLASYAWNELPQPQLLTALGFSNVKPCFSRLSYQSTVVPSRYNALFLSTTTATP